jgi:pyruvate kinase
MLGHYTTGLGTGAPLNDTKTSVAFLPASSAVPRTQIVASNRRTKILVTLGPSTFSVSSLRSLIRAGVDGVRVNFSHGTNVEHRDTLHRVRRLCSEEKRELAVMADLQGPKIRLGDLVAASLSLTEGARVRLDKTSEPGTRDRLPVSVPKLSEAARKGDPILLGDGNVELRVEDVQDGGLETVVVHGGTIHPHQGIYLPRAALRTSILGPKDLEDLSVALEEGVDYVALSFVRNGEDVREARKRAGGSGHAAAFIAKIERAQALENLAEILPTVEGIMVARGDLGIEVPLERLALEQKRLVSAANAAGKIAIVATQMLLSMVASPRPTRAEATDVANAILDGADAVMLSEETAVGQYPLESVDWMDRMARATEPAIDRSRFRASTDASAPPSIETAVSEAAVRAAEWLRAAAIVVPTHSGRTARLVARQRPDLPLLALSANAATRRQLALVWGVRAIESPQHLALEGLRRTAGQLVARELGAEPGRPIVLTAGYPIEGRPTNLFTVSEVPSRARSRAS